MKKIIALTVVISMVIFILFSAGGCREGQGITEEGIEEAIEESIESEGGEAEVDISEGETTITTDEGEMTAGQGTELPDGFPDVVPVYPDMEITASWKAMEDGKETFSFSALTSDSGSTVFDWYKSELEGWENEGEFTSENEGKTISSITADNGTYSLIVTIIETDEGTSVTIGVSEI